jgi:hypothetical protein
LSLIKNGNEIGGVDERLVFRPFVVGELSVVGSLGQFIDSALNLGRNAKGGDSP